MKKSVYLMIFLLIVLPLAAAAVEINVKTLSDHRISVFFRNVGKLSNLDSVHKETGTGEFILKSDASSSEVDLLVILKKDGKEVLKDSYYEISTSSIINLDFLDDEDGIGIVDSFDKEEEEVINETEEQKEETPEEEVVEEEEQESENEAAITGKAVDNVKGVANSKTTYYIIMAVVGVLILGFLIHVGRKKMDNGNFKIRKWKDYDEDRLSSAERKLEEAKKEIDDIKNRKKKLKEAQERFKKDREELENLERD